jgi:hypothetical protein
MKKNRDYRFDSAEIKIKLHSKGYFEVTFPAVRAYDEKGHFFKYQTLDGQEIINNAYVKYFRFDEIMPSDQEREKIYNLIQDILPKDLMRKP